MDDKRPNVPNTRAPFAQEPIDSSLGARGARLEGGSFLPLVRGGEAVQHLRVSLERVERESIGLVRVAASLEEFVRSQEGKYAELEQELNDTALLYVASYQLQARADPKEVLRHVRELLEQLVGVESFVMYLGAPGGIAQVVASKGVPEGELGPQRTSDGALAAAFARKTPLMVDSDPLPRGTLSVPVAVVPLLLGERVVGAIVIASLFAHKACWAQVDQQLLHLLSSHAASSLVAAHLVQRQSDLLGTLAGLGESLK